MQLPKISTEYILDKQFVEKILMLSKFLLYILVFLFSIRN